MVRTEMTDLIGGRRYVGASDDGGNISPKVQASNVQSGESIPLAMGIQRNEVHSIPSKKIRVPRTSVCDTASLDARGSK